jgi:DNA-directed RNA polymerase I, II, and III subunit RPABC5
MIIPVKCFTCGNVLADKYMYYVRTVKERKGDKADNEYYTPLNDKKTVEGQVLDELKLHKMCCRRHMLAHVDIE